MDARGIVRVDVDGFDQVGHGRQQLRVPVFAVDAKRVRVFLRAERDQHLAFLGVQNVAFLQDTFGFGVEMVGPDPEQVIGGDIIRKRGSVEVLADCLGEGGFGDDPDPRPVAVGVGLKMHRHCA